MMTPEDAYLMAINTCLHMMVLWASKRFKLELVSLECTAEGEVEEYIDKTSWFKKVVLHLRIKSLRKINLPKCSGILTFERLA
jgi:uncharacterized OsmC-like protein